MTALILVSVLVLLVAAVPVFRWHLRRDPNAFIEFCFRDDKGKRLRQAPFHRRLQRDLSDHRRVLEVMPRNHGKTIQILARVIWEYGHNPGLRPTFAGTRRGWADEMGQMLKYIVRTNRRVQFVFPALRRLSFGAVDLSGTRMLHGAEKPALRFYTMVPGCKIGLDNPKDLPGSTDIVIFDDPVRAKHSENQGKGMVALLDIALSRESVRTWYVASPGYCYTAGADLTESLMVDPTGFDFWRVSPTSTEDVLWPKKWNSEQLEDKRKKIGKAEFCRQYNCIVSPVPDAGEQ